MTADSLPPQGMQPDAGTGSSPASGETLPTRAPDTGAPSAAEAASPQSAQQNQLPPIASNEGEWQKSHWPVLLFLVALIGFAALAAWGLTSGFRWAAANAAKAAQFSKAITDSAKQVSNNNDSVDPETQVQAEQVLGQLAQGAPGSADAVLQQASEWTGKTHRTPAADQSIGAAINSPDMHVRSAALEAELALDGIPRDARGLASLEQSAGNPSQRAWALCRWAHWETGEWMRSTRQK